MRYAYGAISGMSQWHIFIAIAARAAFGVAKSEITKNTIWLKAGIQESLSVQLVKAGQRITSL